MFACSHLCATERMEREREMTVWRILCKLGKNIGCGHVCVFDCLRLLNESSWRWSVRERVKEN